MGVDEKKRVRVIGAGFSGLTSAYYLQKAGFQVEVFEKSKSFGGLIQTLKTPYGLVETAANAFMNSRLLQEMAKEIGASLLPARREARKRFIFRNRPRRFPVDFLEIFAILKFFFKIIFSRQSLLPKPFESIREWGGRTLSKSLSFYTIETALQGIYAGQPNNMSATLILKNIFSIKPDKKGVKIVRGSVAPAGGMAEFTEKLFLYLQKQGVEFSFGQAFQEKSLGSFVPTLITIPAYEAAQLLEHDEPALSTGLRQIDYLPIITANVFLKSDAKCLQGFGCLFPPQEENLVLGVLFNHWIFEGRVKNAISENWILGGARVKNKKEFLSMSDHDVLNLILAQRGRLFRKRDQNTMSSVLGSLLDVKITRWERAFPHYTIELERLLRHLQPTKKNIFLHGNYLGQLGLTKLLEKSAQMPELIAEQSARP